jgi:hypothetical protein
MKTPKRVPTPAAAAETVEGNAAPAAAADQQAEAVPETSATLPIVADETPAIVADVERPAGELIDCRVLLAFAGHVPNDVIALHVDELDRLEGSSHVDSDPAAVAYAMSLLA